MIEDTTSHIPRWEWGEGIEVASGELPIPPDADKLFRVGRTGARPGFAYIWMPSSQQWVENSTTPAEDQLRTENKLLRRLLSLASAVLSEERVKEEALCHSTYAAFIEERAALKEGV